MPVPVDQHAVKVVAEDGKQHQKQKDGLAPTIKDQVDHKQKPVAELPWGNVIDAQDQGQIEE